MKLGENIKQIRKEKRLTQKDISNVLGVSVASVTMWELGQRCPSVSSLVKLADYLDVSIDYLTERSNNRTVAQDDENPISTIPIFQKYSELDEYGKRNVSITIDNEFRRCVEQGTLAYKKEGDY